MRIVTSLVVAVALVMTVGSARADCTSAPECLARLGLGRIDPKVAAVTGGVAASLIAAGAAVSAARQEQMKPPPPGVVVLIDPEGKKTTELQLIPTPPPALVSQSERRTLPNPAVRFNDTLTNVGLAIGGAAVLTGIILGAVKH